MPDSRAHIGSSTPATKRYPRGRLLARSGKRRRRLAPIGTASRSLYEARYARPDYSAAATALGRKFSITQSSRVVERS